MANNDLRYIGEIPTNRQMKCPLVLVLDVSGSMIGELINQLNEGLQKFQKEILNDTETSSKLDIAIVTFGSSIDIIQEFSLIDGFEMPTLILNGTTRMIDGLGKGIELLEARKHWYKSTGQTYYRPYLVLMTDGSPDTNQDVNGAIQEITRLSENKHLNFWAFGAGQYADMSLLNRLAGNHKTSLVQQLKGTDFIKFFKWLSDSMGEISRSNPDDSINIAPKSADRNPFQILT